VSCFVEPTLSGVGVIDKAFELLGLIRTQPQSLADLVEQTGRSRATVHRIAAALETHGLLRRDDAGRYHIGLAALRFAEAARESLPLASVALSALTELRDSTGESAQLYVREGATRVCLASLESPHGLRTIVGAGAVLPLDVGSGGRVLLGDAEPMGWLASVAEREAGVASVSAPIADDSGLVIASIGVSGPVDRLGPDPGETHGAAVCRAARRVEVDAGLT
jgi:DNA-binding IclR family transcriptional regulator